MTVLTLLAAPVLILVLFGSTIGSVLGQQDYSFVTSWGSEGTAEGQFKFPHGVDIDSSGNVYVVDRDNYRIQKFDSNGKFITMWGSQGSGEGQFVHPHDIVIDSSGVIYVTDVLKEVSDVARIQKFDSNGKFITMWGSAGTGEGQFIDHHGIDVDSSGNVYVSDTNNHRIQKFTSDGKFITMWGSKGAGKGEFNRPHTLAVDSSDNVYVADGRNDRVQKFDSNGKFITMWGSEGTGEGRFVHHHGIEVDPSGNNVYVSDQDSHNV